MLPCHEHHNVVDITDIRDVNDNAVFRNLQRVAVSLPDKENSRDWKRNAIACYVNRWAGASDDVVHNELHVLISVVL